MPLTKKGRSLKRALINYYTKKRGYSRDRAEGIFYAYEHKHKGLKK